jgi:hypothetical protein
MSVFQSPANSSLSPDPTTYEGLSWRDESQYLRAYLRAYNAEIYATQQAEANPTNKQAKDNIISARVAGYLLVELFRQREILTKEPCRYLSKGLLSEDQEDGDANDTVFKVGKFYRNKLIRLCAFYFFHMSFDISIYLQFGKPPRHTPHPHRILLALPSTHWKL